MTAFDAADAKGTNATATRLVLHLSGLSGGIDSPLITMITYI
ncbi:MAG: hypothetical protein N3E45_09300 [Oscillatoriaceae bacterium SKW80]|nr:hypothetical protein [Oscillatoriaceae bacterium SKYG93]MCX8121010.1 hypothetical protein [Oscillatoriaceae bacterium SKW80]MDW8452283.1 hypothetical protein [Oscillatoriaceae cyanobacterium SKYGB_i_bin93]